MAGKLKYETIEEAAEASGIELNDQTRPFLDTFVKKAPGISQKKKTLFDELVALGLEDLVFDKETMDSLKVRGCQHFLAEGEAEAADEFAARFNLSIDQESGSIHRVKARIKPIEERNAGKREGTVGWVTIQLLQDLDHADSTATELADIFVDFAAELGYPDVKATTPASIQWYINYCRKTGVEICERQKKTSAATDGGGSVLGAELTLEKALAPRSFKKKETVVEENDEEELDLE